MEAKATERQSGDGMRVSNVTDDSTAWRGQRHRLAGKLKIQGDVLAAAEDRLGDAAVEEAWLAMAALAGLGAAKGDSLDEFKVAIAAYLILNSGSSRGLFSKVLHAGSKSFDSNVIRQVLSTNVRRFMRNQKNAVFFWDVMCQNPQLAEEMGSRYGFSSADMMVFCFDGAESLPSSILHDNQRDLLAWKRRSAILNATPYNSLRMIEANNNPEAGVVGSGAVETVVSSDAPVGRGAGNRYGM